MFYLTGDTHGRFDRIAQFCKRMSTTKEDVLIILGDAGINFHGGWTDYSKKLDLSEMPITLLCVHGNHEQRPSTIPSYSLKSWRSGQVYMEEQFPSILFAKDGEIYDLDGVKAIAIGGAYSIDWLSRMPFRSWWPDEQPSAEIKEYVESQLSRVNWKIDIVLTHTMPLNYEPREVFLQGFDQTRIDKSTETWLNSIEERLDYRRWYCGHDHTEKTVDRIRILFNDFLAL